MDYSLINKNLSENPKVDTASIKGIFNQDTSNSQISVGSINVNTTTIVKDESKSLAEQLNAALADKSIANQ